MPERDPEAVRQFVEHFASALTDAGLQRMHARVFAALHGTDSGRLTAAEIAESLQVSPAAVSGAVRYLTQFNLIRREREPGSRRDTYVVDNDALVRGDRQARPGDPPLAGERPRGHQGPRGRHARGPPDGRVAHLLRVHLRRAARAHRQVAEAQDRAAASRQPPLTFVHGGPCHPWRDSAVRDDPPVADGRAERVHLVSLPAGRMRRGFRWWPRAWIATPCAARRRSGPCGRRARPAAAGARDGRVA